MFRPLPWLGATMFALALAGGCSGADEPEIAATPSVAVLLFDTDADAVEDEKVPATLEVVEQHDGSLLDLADAPRAWTGPVGIELRGTTSQHFPKRSYSFETRDDTGADIDVGLLGFPAESDWVLYGPYSDKTMMRNVLTYELARRLDRYEPRTRYIELFIDSDYKGIYVATERISRDEQRVDIDRADPLDVPSSGGYIIRRESQPEAPHWRSSQPTDWYYHYPKSRDLSDEQRSYLHDEVDHLEAFLDGVAPGTSADELTEHIEVDAWVDYALIQEFARNADAYKKSFYLVKRSSENGGLFAPGPVWDFNVAWGNIDFLGGADTAGLVVSTFGPQLEFPDTYPDWWANLYANEAFIDAMHCRWHELRTDTWSDDAIAGVIDDQVDIIAPIRQRDDDRWQTIGNYIWPNPVVADTWLDEVDYLRNWATERGFWLDENLPGSCA